MNSRHLRAATALAAAALALAPALLLAPAAHAADGPAAPAAA